MGRFCGLAAAIALVTSSAVSFVRSEAYSSTTTSKAQGISVSADLDQRVGGVVAGTMGARAIPGAAVAIVNKGRLRLSAGYGFIDTERRTQVGTDTVFQIASTTKPFTALAIVLLESEGKISLDVPAKRYLPWLPAIYHGVTVRHLLNHTSGVARDLRADNVDDFSIEEFRKRLEGSQPSSPMATKWEYSNTGYILLGLIVEELAGVPFHTFLSKRVFSPLGMTHTFYGIVPHSLTRARGHEHVDDKVRPAPYYSGGFANGAMSSTVADLAKWIVAIDSGRVVTPEIDQEMRAPATLNEKTVTFPFSGSQASYGFGWFLFEQSTRAVVSHGGAISGFSSIVNRYVDDGTTIIALANSKSADGKVGDADAIARAIASFCFTSDRPC